ncbi:site-specific DNA-methyltransferase [Sphingobacteriales bacterium UPWRP_1]|nr:DNA methyltransferase [Sphingobacteriales bacterium TSM_CSS]PSJ78387.1 site-specific DNA-methyltransferase [Sphingobacteriales bacterium UPWRP_1]
MTLLTPFIDQILHGNCLDWLQKMPENSVDLIFADPPYNLQLQNDLYRPNQTKVDGVFDNWDRFENFEAYDLFTQNWLSACRRVLKPNGTIWVIGSYHNIFRVGAIMQNLGFWLLNDVVWIKTNPMPNFKGTRFNNAHETLIWAAKSKDAGYTFHYKALKTFNDDLQMRSDWYLPICSGAERIKVNGQKAHATQKPEALLYRVILAGSNTGNIVLDPFSGSGTTAAVAKKLNRHFIAIEQDAFYVEIARQRVSAVTPLPPQALAYPVEQKPPRIPMGNLLEAGLLIPGELLYSANKQHTAQLQADASLQWGETVGSIHKVSAAILNKPANNGWTFWFVQRNNQLIGINQLRQQYLKTAYPPNPVSDTLFTE